MQQGCQDLIPDRIYDLLAILIKLGKAQVETGCYYYDKYASDEYVKVNDVLCRFQATNFIQLFQIL
jgi:hypothetical protein